MKKVLLALSLMAGFGVAAQSLAIENHTNKIPLTPAQTIKIQEAMQAKEKMMQTSQTSGGPVNQRMSHTDLVSAVYQPSGVLTNYILPTFQDSTVLVDFGTPENVYNHGVSQTFDLTQSAFQSILGQEPFSENDPYTVDTLYAAGFYDILSPTTGTYTGDTLIVEIIYGLPSNNNVWRTGIQFPGGTFDNQPNAVALLPVRYMGSSSHGLAGGLTWSQKITIKHALKVSDSTLTYHTFVPSAPIQVPAGAKFAFSVTFKPGYTYTAGDTYFTGSGSSTTATLNSFRFVQASTVDGTDNFPYFLEEISLTEASWASAQSLGTSSRYGIWPAAQSFLNEMYSPFGQSGFYFDIWVSGNSTFSVEENTINNNMSIYPNPSNGDITLKIAQGGAYTLEVVNMVGQVVYAESINVNGNEEVKRNFSNLAKGVYLLNVSGDNFAKTSKLTIK